METEPSEIQSVAVKSLPLCVWRWSLGMRLAHTHTHNCKPYFVLRTFTQPFHLPKMLCIQLLVHTVLLKNVPHGPGMLPVHSRFSLSALKACLWYSRYASHTLQIHLCTCTRGTLHLHSHANHPLPRLHMWGWRASLGLWTLSLLCAFL